MKKETPWVIRLITPNHSQAESEVERWIRIGYGIQFSVNKKQVMIKKGGPNGSLFIVRTRVKP